MSTPPSPSTGSEPWLTKRELAGRLRCSPRTIERLKLPAMRVGGQNRYRLSEVAAFLAHKSRPARLLRLPTSKRDSVA